jgi:DNA-binding beta-propeller fold protein YncE
VNKYLIILCFICYFILTGCIIGKHTTAPQIKDYICTGEYNLEHSKINPFTVDPQGNFYVTDNSIDSRMSIKKYNSQGKYITGWVPEIKKRKKNCWFTERKNHPIDEELTDIYADKEYVYIAYTGAYRIDYPEENFSKDYTSHIEQFDLNGKFITARKPKEDTFGMAYLRFITKDRNGNFYLAFYGRIEKYDSNWKLQSVLYPFKQKWYVRSDYPESTVIGDLAVDSEGYIYILINRYINSLCGTNDHIAKFDSSGKFIKERIPEDKDNESHWGLEIDPDNNIFILEIKNKTFRIQKFDSNLNFVTTWEFEGGGDGYGGSFNGGIRIDSTGNVYVDTGEFTIKKFSPKK